MHGKAVLVSGASSGVGFCVAEAFAAAGADVALLSRRREGLERAAERVRAHGRRALVLPADVADRPAVAAAVDDAVAAFGRLDVLVPCAAVTVFGRFEEVEAEDFDRAVEVSFTGAVNLVRAALPALERSGGAIVAMGSLMSRQPLPMLSSYAAAKHAERGFLNSLRIELEARGSAVDVSMLHPGAIDTPVWHRMPTATGRLPRRPLEAYDPMAVAEALVHLASHPRPETVFGAETKVFDLLWNRVRPVGALVLVAIYRYFRSGRRTTDIGTRPLREGVGEGRARDGIAVTRPSLTYAVRRRLVR